MRFVIGVWALWSAGFVSAQNDFGLWSGIDVRVPLTGKLDAGLEVQARFRDNVHRVDNTFLSPYLRYDVVKNFRVAAAYRMTNEADAGSLFGGINTHRLSLDLEGRNLIDLLAEKSRFNAGVRVRYTHETTGGDRNNDYLRGQLEIKYNLPKIKLEPQLSGELFYHFNDQFSYSFTEVRSGGRFNRYRVRLGLNYPLNKRMEVQAFYMLQSKIETPKKEFILGIGYTYQFKRLGSGKK